MTSLNVNRIKACLDGEESGAGVKGGESVKILVGDDIVIGDGASFLIDGVAVSDHGGYALSARVGELEHEELANAVLLHSDPAHISEESLEGVHIFLGEHHLTHVGSTLGANGISLKPDSTCRRLSRLHVFFDGKLSGGAVSVTVTAFHRLEHNSVGNVDISRNKTVV